MYFIGSERNKKTLKKYELLSRVTETIYTLYGIYCGNEFISGLCNSGYDGEIYIGLGLLINFGFVICAKI